MSQLSDESTTAPRVTDPSVDDNSAESTGWSGGDTAEDTDSTEEVQSTVQKLDSAEEQDFEQDNPRLGLENEAEGYGSSQTDEAPKELGKQIVGRAAQWRQPEEQIREHNHQPPLEDYTLRLHYDIWFELCKFLDPVAPWKYERVSKPWQLHLSHPSLRKLSLKQWYRPSDPKLNCQYGPITEEELQKKRLEHLQRFRQFKPRSMMDLATSFKPHNTVCEVRCPQMSLRGEFLAWQQFATRNTEIWLLNLRTGLNVRWQVHGVGWQVHLTANFLVILYNALNFSKLATYCLCCLARTGRILHNPGGHGRTRLSIDGDIVAIYQRPSSRNGTLAGDTEICILDCSADGSKDCPGACPHDWSRGSSGDRHRTFEISYTIKLPFKGQTLWCGHLTVNALRRSFTIERFEACADIENRSALLRETYSLDGKPLTEDISTEDKLRSEREIIEHPHGVSCWVKQHPIDFEGSFVTSLTYSPPRYEKFAAYPAQNSSLAVFCPATPQSNQEMPPALVRWKSVTMKFTTEQIFVSLPSGLALVDWGENDERCPEKLSTYLPRFSARPPHPFLNESNFLRLHRWAPLITPQGPQSVLEACHTLLSNEFYMVFVVEFGFTIFTFDPDVDFVGRGRDARHVNDQTRPRAGRSYTGPFIPSSPHMHRGVYMLAGPYMHSFPFC